MAKLKCDERNCVVCGKVYSIIGGYSNEYCHVICLNKRRREKELAKQEEKTKQKELGYKMNPLRCKYCKETFTKTFYTEKYCSEMCREKLYAENKEAKKESAIKKKKVPAHKVNQWLEQKRLKGNSTSLKQYNSVRG